MAKKGVESPKHELELCVELKYGREIPMKNNWFGKVLDENRMN